MRRVHVCGLSRNETHTLTRFIYCMLYSVPFSVFLASGPANQTEQDNSLDYYCPILSYNCALCEATQILPLFARLCIHGHQGCTMQALRMGFFETRLPATPDAYFNDRALPLNLVIKSINGVTMVLGDCLMVRML